MGRTKKLIGVTGMLASGKTTVTDIFVSMGAVKIDADAIAHDLLSGDDELRNTLIDLFGEIILTDSNIDRVKLRHEVLEDSDKLKKLCKIMHPVIIANIKKKSDDMNGGIVVVDAPLLIETGLHEHMDMVVVVHAGEDVIMERALKRGLSEKEARKIMSEQMPFSEKVKFADFVIYNSNDINVIKKGVEKIWQKL